MTGVRGRLDQRPAQVFGTPLGERAAPIVFPGLVYARAEPRVAGELSGGGEALDVADLGCDRVPEYPGDAGDRGEQGDVGVLGAELPELALNTGDLPRELVDQEEARAEGAGPGLGKREP